MPHQMAAARHLHSAPWWAARQTSPSARGWWPTPVARGWWPTPVAAALRTRSSARRSPPRSGRNCASWPHHRRRPCGRTAAPLGVSSSARHRITSLVLLAGKKPDVPKFLPAYQKAAKIAAAAAVRLGVRKQPRRPAHRPAACAYLPLAASRGRCTLTGLKTACDSGGSVRTAGSTRSTRAICPPNHVTANRTWSQCTITVSQFTELPPLFLSTYTEAAAIPTHLPGRLEQSADSREPSRRSSSSQCA